MATQINQLPSRYSLDRKIAVPAVIGEHSDFVIVCGLAGPARDVAHLTKDGPHIFAMGGAMGAACSVGLGLALAQPDRSVLVVTGDGELLMNVGTLATIATAGVTNLSILCVDNGHYGETGYQRSHTSLGVDLEVMARGAGIGKTLTVQGEEQLLQAHDALRLDNCSVFVNLQTCTEEPPTYPRLLDPAAVRLRFKKYISNLQD